VDVLEGYRSHTAKSSRIWGAGEGKKTLIIPLYYQKNNDGKEIVQDLGKFKAKSGLGGGEILQFKGKA